MKTKDFGKILLEAIDEGLEVLGEGGKYMVFFYLERKHSIRKHDIPRNPEAFVKGLEEIFGVGTDVLERIILKRICSKMGLRYEEREGQRLIDFLKEENLVLTQPSKRGFSKRKRQKISTARLQSIQR